MSTVTLFTEEVFLSEMLPKALVVRVVVLPLPQAFAHVTPLVNGAEVMQEGVLVKETVVAKFAERVSPVRRVVWVSLAPVNGQLRARVSLVLCREQFEVGHTYVAVVDTVSPASVVSQLVEAFEWSLRLHALGATIASEGVVPVTKLGASEQKPVLPVAQRPRVLDEDRVWLHFVSYRYLF